MYFYIFHSGNGEIPNSLKGTVADPAVFMSSHELLLSEDYSKIRNFLFFVVTPLEWLIYLFILLLGLSRLFEKGNFKSKINTFPDNNLCILVIFATVYCNVANGLLSVSIE